ncbi:signal recognition particle-docking protein FtsY [Candidatus Woesearchaeota archaeon]|nr:MAG: signal recognition particle-docking protein FtsY [Candidatus Woesearchaeota archaeon]
MFGFLKKTLDKALSKFKKDVEETAVEEAAEEQELEVIEEAEKELPKKKAEEKRKDDKKIPAERPKAEEAKKDEKKRIAELEKKEFEKAAERKEEVRIKREGEEKRKAEPERKENIEIKKPEERKERKKETIIDEKKEEKKLDRTEKKEATRGEYKREEKKPSFFKSIFGKKEKAEKEVEEEIIDEELEEEALEKISEKEEEKKEELLKEIKEEETEEKKIPEEPKEKKSFFDVLKDTISKVQLSGEKFDEIFWDLEVAMLENNVAVEVIEKIKEDLKRELTKDKIPRKHIDELIKKTLKKSIEELFDVETFDLVKRARQKKPYVIAMIGVNGSGKTTTLAKLAHLFKKNNFSVVIAASDTFRAAAIQQLQEHAEKLQVKMIKHDYDSDPAAVAFDAISHAKAKGIDIVLIDTAGRLHSNTNLMDELEKVIRVNKPDLKIFVGESITGNDCVEQAKIFNELVGIDAIILAKADVDEKGGAAISVSYVTKKPILYLGTGQTYDDLQEFKPALITESLDL